MNIDKRSDTCEMKLKLAIIYYVSVALCTFSHEYLSPLFKLCHICFEWFASGDCQFCDLRFEIQLNNIQAVFKDLKSVANLIQLWSDKASEQTVR